MEEVGRNIDLNKGVFVFISDNKSLLNDYITPEKIVGLYFLCYCVEECQLILVIIYYNGYATLFSYGAKRGCQP
jgi:hypothetical protein